MKKHLTLLILTLLSICTFAQAPNYVPTNGLVGYWPFNGNANDESGNGNNGTVNGAALTTDRFGLTNKAYSFDGVNDLISIAAQSTISPQSNYSVSFWFNSSVSNYNGAFLSVGSWFCKLGHDNPGLFYKDELGNQANNWYEQAHFLTEPSINNWHHLIISKSNNIVKIYLDTVYIGSMTTYGYSNFNPTSIIQFGYYCCQEFFNGKLDDFGFWSRELTSCEIQDLYNAELNSVAVNGGTDQTLCEGQSTSLFGSGASTYTWNNNVQNGVGFVPTATSSYTVTGTDANGCVGTDTVNIVVNNATASTLNATALDLYVLNGQIFTESGTYTQVTQNVAGCDSTITLNLSLNFTGLNELENIFSIAPNPATDQLTISSSSLIDENYILFDPQGRQVLTGSLTGTTTQLDLSKLAIGNYLLQIGEKLTPVKLVKE
jgi:hypothetical protein